MATRAKKRAGRPPAKNPRSVQRAIRLSQDEDAANLADIDRLTRVTGTEWDYSRYARAAMTAFRGKHLAD